MKSIARVVFLFFVASALAGQDDFVDRWNEFATAMNKYVVDLTHGENNYGELKAALRKWHRLEHEQGWDAIK